MAKKHVDTLKAKQKKQKIIAALLGVVFLGVAAFQGPKLWKQLHPASAPATLSYNEKPAGTATTAGTPTLAAPTLGGSQTPVANGNGWNNTDVTVTFTCGDALSGIATCTAPTTVFHAVTRFSGV